jgi:ABC-type lipoprotein release transport system permease subunit
MKLAFQIAWRYFFSRHLSNVINIISGIALTGVVVGSLSLIVVLSVFNGFEQVVVSLFNSFDPDLKITPERGKYFDPDSAGLARLRGMEGIAGITPSIEENVLLKYDDNQTIARFRAIEPRYLASTGIDSMIIRGRPGLLRRNTPQALIGGGIAVKLGATSLSDFKRLTMFLPRKTGRVMMSPGRAFVQSTIKPGGIFAIQQEFDNKYILLPLEFGRQLAQESRRVTAIEINLKPDASLEALAEKVRRIAGPDFQVADRYQQHQTLYKVFRSEKLAVYLILSFILLIAAFNLVGSLTMIAIEKKRDMAILKSMGASAQLVRRIFLVQGTLVALIGAVLGLGLGSLVGWLQQTFGFISIGSGETFVLDAYPVAFQSLDFVSIFLTVMVLGFLAALYPANVAARRLTVTDLRQ